MMRAVQYFSYGGGSAGLKISEVPIPRPNGDEVLIKVEAASLNPIDWRIQEGILRPILPPQLLSRLPIPIPFAECKFPFIPGVEVAGEVTEVGANVKTLKKGDKVVSLLNYLKGGALAQFVVAHESHTAVRPTGSNAAEYATLPVAGVTALQILKSTGAKFDGTCISNILITAASGGVGHYLVQLAHLVGMHVTATCGARNIDLVKSLGADEVLDYKTTEGQQLASPSGKLFDYVINCVPSTEWSNTLDAKLTSDGKVIEVTPTPMTMARYMAKKLAKSKRKLEVFMLELEKDDLQFMISLVNKGAVRTILDSTYTLDKAREAWDRCMGGHATGKIVVEI